MSKISVFISHASEDKTRFVRPLANGLSKYELNVWYDEFSLKPGDGLRRSIESGLVSCDAGIIVLSPKFFAKEWPQRELDALFAGEIAGLKKIIPIWLDVDQKFLLSISPMIVDKIAIDARRGVSSVIREVVKTLGLNGRFSGEQLADLIERTVLGSVYSVEFAARACQTRFLQMNAYKQELHLFLEDNYYPYCDEEGNAGKLLEEKLAQRQRELRMKYDLPEDAYLTDDEPEYEENMGWWMRSLEKWTNGTMNRKESRDLWQQIDLAELDELYILLGVPNFSVAGIQGNILYEALTEIGCGFHNGFKEVEKLCRLLREEG